MHQSCTMFPLLLLALAPLLEGALPGFIEEEEGGGRECDGSMCWWTTFDMHYHTDKQVGCSTSYTTIKIEQQH